MLYLVPQFADGSSSGIGAFNINLKEFVFQLVTFVIVLYVLKRWALPPLVKTIDDRRKTLEQSLEHAKQTEETLAKAAARSEEILDKARNQADEALAEAKKAAKQAINDAENAAAARAELIVKDAEARLGQERDKLRQELRKELAVLVADVSEKVIEEKLDAKNDMSLIERVIKGVAR
ncbi:MAG TPA: F0F1 ATP synthase subunit B [Candidatus Binatia bacterium]|nr:F0F1 ATP synthase subunit B [Candidatus Binatia bacterium]